MGQLENDCLLSTGLEFDHPNSCKVKSDTVTHSGDPSTREMDTAEFLVLACQSV